jgi:hypothetical protein
MCGNLHISALAGNRGSNKDRTLMLPQALEDGLRAQLGCARSLRLRDRADHCPGVELPEALARKYPRAGEAWAWHWVFPQATLSRDPRSGVRRRHHRFDQTFQRAFKRAVVAAGLADKLPRSGALISGQAERRPQPRAAQPVRWCRSAGPPPIRETRRKPAWAARSWPVRLRRHRPRRGKGRRGLHDPRLHPPIRNQGAKAVSAVTSR